MSSCSGSDMEDDLDEDEGGDFSRDVLLLVPDKHATNKGTSFGSKLLGEPFFVFPLSPEKTFYLFGCSVCNKSYRVIRQQSSEEKVVEKKITGFANHSHLLAADQAGKRNASTKTNASSAFGKTTKAKKLFSDDEDDNEEGEEEEDSQQCKKNNQAEKQQHLRNEQNNEESDEKLESVADFAGLYLKFIREPPSKRFDHELQLLERYNQEARANGEETFEFNPSVASGGEDFYERLQRQTNQRARICFNGKPLIPNKKKKNSKNQKSSNVFPKCDSCGKDRHFAFQLTPGCLDEVEGQLKLPCDWATLLVYACEASCTLKPGCEYVEELCVVIEEE